MSPATWVRGVLVRARRRGRELPVLGGMQEPPKPACVFSYNPHIDLRRWGYSCVWATGEEGEAQG